MILLFVLCIKLSVLHLCVSDLGYQCGFDDRGTSMNPKVFLIEEKSASVYQKTLNALFKTSCQKHYEISVVTLEKANLNDNIIHFAVPDYYDGKSLGNFVYAGNVTKDDNTECIRRVKGQPEYDCHEFAHLVSPSAQYIDEGQLYTLVQELKYVPPQENDYEDDEYDYDYEELDYEDFIRWRFFQKHGIGYIPFRRRFERHPQITKTEPPKQPPCKPLRKESPKNLAKVLLCIRGNQKEVNIKPLTLIQVQEKDCFEYFNSENLLAVVTPGPYKAPDSLIPTIFYETAYLTSEEMNAFPNSMNLVPWRLLKYGFLKFIQKVGWQRVAIVSDDSDFSLAFENELVTLFSKEEKIVHTVIRCEDAKCEISKDGSSESAAHRVLVLLRCDSGHSFRKTFVPDYRHGESLLDNVVLQRGRKASAANYYFNVILYVKIAQEIKRASANIVIANVEQSNAIYLIKYTHRWITWLFKDMLEIKEYLIDNQIAFGFEMRIDTTKTACNVEDNILTSLSSISQAYNKTAEYASQLNKRDFYRHFADEVRKATPEITEATIIVRKIFNKGWSEISRISVKETGAETIVFTDPFSPNVKPTDGTAHCLISSNDFFKPCNDLLIVVFTLILLTFLVTLSLITCFFDPESPYNDPRYQSF